MCNKHLFNGRLDLINKARFYLCVKGILLICDPLYDHRILERLINHTEF
jgi:hypothetical protein